MECGDVVWARMRGYPWWPAVLAPCPTVEKGKAVNDPNIGEWKVKKGKKVKLHCIFLAWNTERAWLLDSEYKKFKREDVEEGEGRKRKYKVKNKLKYAFVEAIKIALELLDNPNNLTVSETVDFQEEKKAEDVKIKSYRKSSCNAESMNSEWSMSEGDIMSNRSEEVEEGDVIENDILVNEVAMAGREQDAAEIQAFLKEHSTEDIEKRLETWTKLNDKLVEFHALHIEELKIKKQIETVKSKSNTLNRSLGWISDEFRGIMRERMREEIEDRMKTCGELIGEKDKRKLLRTLGLGNFPVEVEPTQSRETIKKNVDVIERDMFAASSGFKDQYLGQVMRMMVDPEIFPSNLTEGCVRWCLVEEREVCKVVAMVNRKLMWVSLPN